MSLASFRKLIIAFTVVLENSENSSSFFCAVNSLAQHNLYIISIRDILRCVAWDFLEFEGALVYINDVTVGFEDFLKDVAVLGVLRSLLRKCLG